MPVRPAAAVYRTWSLDSRRWESYRPRDDDIVIATYPKCGTTWMQQIVALLVFRDTVARPLMEISPWLERRLPHSIEAVIATIEAQDHRRFLKTHLPADGLPLHDAVKYIHVARDGRDACLSYHNHTLGFTPQMFELMDRGGLEDDTVGRPYPRSPADPADYFHAWLTQGALPGHEDGLQSVSFFRFEASWWQERARANVLLVHYADLKADLAGEMRRIAGFLGIAVPEALWPTLVEAAGFEAMRRVGDVLLGSVGASFRGGGGRFFHKGTNERWHGLFRDADLALYDARMARLPPACERWVRHGRAGAEPATVGDGAV